MHAGTKAKIRSAIVTALAITAGFALPARAAEVSVDQRNMTFVPGSVTIKAGDSVRFTNTDRIAHDITVVNPNGTKVDEGMDSYKNGIIVNFPNAGTFYVVCRIHPNMKMTVNVK